MPVLLSGVFQYVNVAAGDRGRTTIIWEHLQIKPLLASVTFR